MGSSTGAISNCRFVDLDGATNAAASYVYALGESNVRVSNCIFKNISNSFLRAVVYVNNDLANLTLSNSHFHNISGNANAIVENRGTMTIVNSTFNDIALSGNSPEGIVWASEKINNNSRTYINSSSFWPPMTFIIPMRPLPTGFIRKTAIERMRPEDAKAARTQRPWVHPRRIQMITPATAAGGCGRRAILIITLHLYTTIASSTIMVVMPTTTFLVCAPLCIWISHTLISGPMREPCAVTERWKKTSVLRHAPLTKRIIFTPAALFSRI